MIGLWLGLSLARALGPEEHLRLALVAGGEVSGYFFESDGERVAVTRGGEVVWVSLSLVEGAWRDGAPLDPAQLRAEAEDWADARRQAATDPSLRRPPPLAVGAASALWPGAGHAMLGDWGTAAGYTVVELALIGAASYWLLAEDAVGPLLPIIGLDLVFRSYAVADSARIARRRRSLVISPYGPGGGGLWVGLHVGPAPQPAPPP